MDEIAREAIARNRDQRNGQTDYFSQSQSKQLSRKSSTTALTAPQLKNRSATFTSESVEDLDPSTQPSSPNGQLRGPFSTLPHPRRQIQSSLHPDQNTTLSSRPDPARRNTSTAYFFSKLAGVEAANRPPTLRESTNESSTAVPHDSDTTVVNSDTTIVNQDSHNVKEPKAGPSTETKPNMTRGWTSLRSKVRSGEDPHKNIETISKYLSGQELVAELGLGLLPVMMLKMSLMDRDDHGGHRIPILMNYLKLKITDSVYPYHQTHALFRVELEYGDGLLKWVIYRELKDFVNLHAHYRVANFTQSSAGSPVNFPSFPKTSLPYFNKLKREKGGEVAKAEFARNQRDLLETYLLRVIRNVMFRPEANRLAKFLEISALALQLAHQGGSTGKQGYLQLVSNNVSRKIQSGFHPLEFTRKHEPKWFVVRESYIAILDSPDGTELFDLFIFDADFHLERPKRLYRKGLSAVKGTFEGSADKSGHEKSRRDSMPDEAADEKGPNKGRTPDPNDPSTAAANDGDPQDFAHTSQHTFYLNNGERRLKIVTKNERIMDQFIASIERMATKSLWVGKNRFDSFAPIRLNVACQWLVDGRDYYWNLSRAVAMAKRVIYIHDWWLSPELYLRRPPATNGQWRLDRLLKRKAQEGVKIFVILYKEVGQSFTPVDSLYSKNRLNDLHPNINVQRSPDSDARNLLWSHHEKICVVDEMIAFMGGIDLCFGRWDTPGHTLIDDRPKNYSDIEQSFNAQTKISDADVDDYQIWPGKDYSNQRAGDFHSLSKPEEDMYDRKTVPRQPWHDVGMQIVGQPARDLCRHFIQRWNWLLRIKHHSRVMPFLIPPADLTPADLEKHKIVGTCETQICRSAGPWSLGTPKRIEHSIQNAYCKAIQLSDAFVYIENQYFSTSTIAENVEIENKIGDALVSRIIRAHSEGMPWRACIIIPLTPGYPMPMDSPDAAAVRMIMEAQARSMYRGEHSIFARLRREGIDPAEYINFFSLRAWGKMKSGQLVSQDVYIHNKIMVVDDRLAIIGSANINERSQRGDRDSEVACVIRDTDMIDSTMAGLPYKVGRFAHTLRVRLMREHLGLDVDALARDKYDEVTHEAPATPIRAEEQTAWDPDAEQERGGTDITSQRGPADRYASKGGTILETAAEMASGAKQSLNFALGAGGLQYGGGVGHSQAPRTQDGMPDEGDPEALESGVLAGESLEDRAATRAKDGEKPSDASLDPEDGIDERNRQNTSYQESELRHMVGKKTESSVVPSSDRDPSKLSVKDKIMDKIHKSVPSEGDAKSVTSDVSESERQRTASGVSRTTDGSLQPFKSRHRQQPSNSRAQPYTLPTPAPEVKPDAFKDPLDPSFYLDTWTQGAARNTEIYRKVFRCTPDDRCLTWVQFKEWDLWEKRHHKPPRDAPQQPDRSPTRADSPAPPLSPQASRDGRPSSPSRLSEPGKTPNKPIRITDEGFTMNELGLMEKLLGELCGNLVIYPVKFLESEAVAGNNLFSRDRIQPMAVYD